MQVLHIEILQKFLNLKELVISKEGRNEKIIANQYEKNPLRMVQSGFKIQRGITSSLFEIITKKTATFY